MRSYRLDRSDVHILYTCRLVRSIGNSVLIGEAIVTWPLDGDFKPLMVLFFQDGSTQETTTQDIVFHVYPQEQLTQLESTNVSVILTYAVFVLTLLGVIGIGVELWPKEEKQNTAQNQNSSTEKRTEPNDIVKSKADK